VRANKLTRRSGRSHHKKVRRRVPSTPAAKPFVTAVIPSYNYGRFLPECVTSVLTQRDVDVRVIVVDDASTDETPDVTVRLAAADSRVEIVRHEHNMGHLPSVNEALALVDSEYVVKLDADDLLTPGSLARSTTLLETCPHVGFVYGRPRHFSGPVPRISDAKTRSWTIWSGPDWIAGRCRSTSNVISQPEVVMRMALVRRAGLVRCELDHTSDMHLWLTLSSMSDVGRINGPAQGLYRVHDASMQRTIHSGMMVDFEGRRDAFDAVFATEAGGRLPDARRLHELARRNLAAAALDRACRAYERGRTDEHPAEELVTFALETWHGARQLPEWSALERRRSVGVERAPRYPRFVARALARRGAEEFGHWVWLRTGEL
jgi:Glycosyl transferase family 2